MALAYLDVKFLGEKDEWVLIYKKGMRYLRNAGYSNKILDDAKRLISS